MEPFQEVVDQALKAFGNDVSYACAMLRQAGRIENVRKRNGLRTQFKEYSGGNIAPSKWEIEGLQEWLVSMEMSYAILECGHPWYYQHVPPDDQVWCSRCQKFWAPKDLHKAPAPKNSAPTRRRLSPADRIAQISEARRLEEQGLTRTEIANKLGFSISTVSKWLIPPAEVPAEND